ncbi:MAG: amidohydrolase family protein, partial [Candidatus Aminicenantales bacterium]
MKRFFLVWAAITMCFSALALRAKEQPLATRVEHFLVVSDRAQTLFGYFKDTFQLPEVWPFYQHGTFASGGLSLGNAVLEFVSFPKEDNKPAKTEFRGIAFEPAPDADATAAELTNRNIAHTNIQSYKSQIPGGDVRVEWSSVGLSNLPPATTDIFFCDYKNREAVAQRRKTASDELARRRGGPLGIVAAAEITVGVQDLEEARSKWCALLRPSPRISDDAFVFDIGPRIQLVHAELSGIQGIVLEVRSVDEAEKFLKVRRFLAKDDAGHIAISPAAVDGLAIRLTDATQGQAEVQRQPIIDVHLHSESLQDLKNWGPNPVTGAKAPESVEEHIKLTLAMMDRYNIVLGIASGEGETIEQLRQAAPDRIWAGPSYVFPGLDIENLRPLYQSGRLRIMGEVCAQYDGLSPSDPVLDPYFALAESLEIPACIHMGMSFPGITESCPKFRVAVGNPLLLEELLNRHPKLRVWMAHLGFPFLAETIGILNVYPQVYVDSSAIDWIEPGFSSYLKELIKYGFAKRIMFGSDQMTWP